MHMHMRMHRPWASLRLPIKLWTMSRMQIDSNKPPLPVRQPLPPADRTPLAVYLPICAVVKSPIIPLILALLARRGRRSSGGPLAHRRRADGAASGLPLVRSRREVVPEGLLVLIQRPGSGVDRSIAVLASLDELVEALLRCLRSRLRRRCDAAADGPCLGCKV